MEDYETRRKVAFRNGGMKLGDPDVELRCTYMERSPGLGASAELTSSGIKASMGIKVMMEIKLRAIAS